MTGTVENLDVGGLERSRAGRPPERIRFSAGVAGLQRAEVYLSECAFTPHRHDTYAIGITTAGVQTFRYRGAGRVCLPGQLHVLHPDEPHDGAAGTEDGFGYQILYLSPDLVGAAVPGRALPFVADPVRDRTATPRPLLALLADVLGDLDEPLSELRVAETAATVADALLALSGHPRAHRGAVDIRAVSVVREYLAAHAREQTPVSVLEELAGTDRFTLARHFRRAFGTSPDRYRTLRRLDIARAAIADGQSLARAAAEAGFADQSHLTRQFKRAFGLSPGRWRVLTKAANSG